MARIGSLVLLAMGVLGVATPALAQLNPRYFDEASYARVGLEEAWTTQAAFDSQRTRTDGLTLQVVGLESYERLQRHLVEAYQVSYAGQSRWFRENDLDGSGNPLGREEARRLAEKLVIQLTARGIEAKLDTLRVPQTNLYVQTSRGLLQALDAESGQTLWSVAVGLPNHPAVGVAANDTYVAAINGSRLYLIQRTTGEPVWDRDLRRNPASGMTMDERSVYVPCSDGALEIYTLPDAENDHRITPPGMYRGGAEITAPPTTTPSLVTWGNERGRLFVANTTEGLQMQYRYQASSAILGQPEVIPPDRILLASDDGYVTCLDQARGAIVWTFSTGHDLHRGALVLPSITLVPTASGLLYCLTTADGTERWQAAGIADVLAVGKTRLYARDALGQLVALDLNSGARIASLPMSAYRAALTNRLTDRVYLATNDGTILCLRELGARFPTIQRALPEPPQTEEQPERRRSGAGEGTEAAPPDSPNLSDDPFGGDAFGDDAAADDAAAEDAGADDAEMEDAGSDLDEPANEEAPADEAAEDDPFGFG